MMPSHHLMRPRSDDPSTADLLARGRAGDAVAIDLLFQREVPLLRRWAHGRLPRWTRDLADTSDLVQDTVLQTLRRLDTFEARGEGALQAYLRQALINRVRGEIRRVSRRPEIGDLQSGHPTTATSPLEAAVAGQTLERYERALAELAPRDRTAIVAQLELGCTHAQLAEILGTRSPNAARMALERALLRLARRMRALEMAPEES